MIGVTAFGILLTPVFYVVIRGLLEPKRSAAPEGAKSASGAAAGLVGLLVLCGLSTLLLNGCAVGPNYKQPSTPVAKAFANGTQTNLTAEPSISRWWHGFNDETLNRLIDRSIAENFDLRIATARVREARAQRTAALLEALPIVTSSGGYTRQLRTSDQLGFPLTPDQRVLQFYDAGFDATWEVDIFGRARRGIEAANALWRQRKLSGGTCSSASRQKLRVTTSSCVAPNSSLLWPVETPRTNARR